MSAYSGKWVWIPMYAAIWYVMLRNFHWKVTLLCMIGLALTITFADQACATVDTSLCGAAYASFQSE